MNVGLSFVTNVHIDDSGGEYARVGSQGIWVFSETFSQIGYELKTALKIIALKVKEVGRKTKIF